MVFECIDVYYNCVDVGINFMAVYYIVFSYVSSWLDSRAIQSERANLTILFDKYVPVCLEMLKTRFKTITPIADISHLQVGL